MRKREDIEEENRKFKQWDDSTSYIEQSNKLILEATLDIRDLLEFLVNKS